MPPRLPPGRPNRRQRPRLPHRQAGQRYRRRKLDRPAAGMTSRRRPAAGHERADAGGEALACIGAALHGCTGHAPATCMEYGMDGTMVRTEAWYGWAAHAPTSRDRRLRLPSCWQGHGGPPGACQESIQWRYHGMVWYGCSQSTRSGGGSYTIAWIDVYLAGWWCMAPPWRTAPRLAVVAPSLHHHVLRHHVLAA